MKKTLYLLALVVMATTRVFAQDSEPTRVKTLGFEFMTGYLNSTPVGVYAREMRNDIKDRRVTIPGYSGQLLPKSSAYVGILFDYRFHEKVGIGSGIIYAPKGWWLFENRSNINTRTKNFYTVDYFEFPLFLQVYPHKHVWFRIGPVLSFAGITKIRTATKVNGETTTDKYHFGEKGSPLAKELVPGLEGALNVGNPYGLHGTFTVQYSGSMYKDIDIKPVLLCLGIGYTLDAGAKQKNAKRIDTKR